MISRKYFSVFGSHEKITKMQTSEFGKCRRNSAMSGRRCRIPARKFDRIRPKWPDYGRKLPDPARSMAGSGHIRPDQWPDPSRSGQNLVARCCWAPAPIEYRQPDVVRLLRQLDSDDWQLLNSDNRISNVHVRTKSLISKNDLRF
jgi:hypothetical protein